ncbi:response regulator [Massilia sp. Dwa41.01b]|uniref:LytR/AlgR family response regulator transcription factor n=1 Tax=unclassified Massilia TaxID=2609279 RepID=UPI0016019E05|nr:MULTISPECIES: LytTR family transcriptional regulator DNA-binding domain-containing protein [unclassified Massilia]QNA87680.1 response regulator [Massilia sp. Dwa41.01b]QNA98582.1 response regulator [Massilia sp. Se16.2.3]
MKAFVVDDSRLARSGLIRMLAAHPEIEVVGEADHPDSALPLIGASSPDVLFLDIQMAGADAFDLLARLDPHPRIVFTTAHAEYAVRSFDFDTVDYLLKPISSERLAQAIGKLGARALPVPDEPVRAPLDEHSRIFIKDGERCHMVPLASIRCFESCKNHVQVYFGDGHAYVKKSLSSVEERLPRTLFLRVSRQHIVNLSAIVTMLEAMSGGYLVTLDTGKKIEISRRHAALLKETLSL